jgi:hypothetical protein
MASRQHIGNRIQEHTEVEFRLIYEGPLPAEGSSGGRTKDKQRLRKHFHKQLRELWNQHPDLRGQAVQRFVIYTTPPNLVSDPGPNVRQMLTPRKRLSIVVTRVDRKPSLEGATCTRTLCPDGTLMQVVYLFQSRPRREELTDQELERWIETFPIVRMRPS